MSATLLRMSAFCLPLLLLASSVALAQSTARSAAVLESVRGAGAKIVPLHEKKRDSAPGDWLASHPESGQTFDQYLATDPNRPTRTRTTIYLQPLGEFKTEQQQVMDRAKEFLGVFYGTPIKVQPPIALESIPASARRDHPSADNPQILTTYVLDKVLRPRRPSNAVAVLALTPIDLWPGEGWNFVFGQGEFRGRVGVYSLARYGDPAAGNEERQLYLRRTLKVACHETGHMLGIAHCTDYECGMNGSNHTDELDRNRLAFCPECEQKVWWACRLDPRRRYERLLEFAEQNELADEKRIWSESLARLRDGS